MTTTSDRTVVRDTIIEALQARLGTEGMRLDGYDVSPAYLSIEECKRFPTYCVIVTDETLHGFSQQQRECEMTVLVICYVKHERDVRMVLDAAIEDVYDTMLLVQGNLPGIAWMLKLEEIKADEGATATKPHAQAVHRWTCSHGRAPR